MSHFCLLENPDRYIAHDLDLVADVAAREYWLGLFASHFEELARHAIQSYGRGATRQTEAAKSEFLEILEGFRQDPASDDDGKLNCVVLNRIRAKVLNRHNLVDPYRRVKQQETRAAIGLYPQTVRELHAMDNEPRWAHLVRGIFAGNVFDLGANPADRPEDFLSAIEAVRERPWKIDDYDALWDDLADAPPTKWAKAVVFVDNAGSDFVLGIMPFVRELALEGTAVALAANESPALNDMTADETVDVVEQLAAVDPELDALIRAGMLEVVSSGSDTALLDLSDVSDELNEAAQDAELVVLEGMGRALESNLDATFRVDALHLAVAKDPEVAKRFGGEVYDCVCKYAPVAGEEEQADDSEG